METTLYLKTHNVTGLKYLGITTSNPFRYKGSGKYWRNHLKIHGNDVTTEVLQICKTDDDIVYWGLHYSNMWDVVNSSDFANLVPEKGADSSGMLGKHHTKEAKDKISKSLYGRKRPDYVNFKISEALKGTTPWNKGARGYSQHTEEHKLRLKLKMTGESNPFYGKVHSDSFKEHQRNNQKRSIKCPHCYKSGGIRIMKRWHFDNCRKRES